MAVENLDFHGFNAVKLSFNNYEATIIYGRGCNVINFVDTDDTTTILHYPTEEEIPEFMTAPQRFGCAPLFFPNKIVHGRFTRDNVLYDLEGAGLPFAHGIIKEVPFEMSECRESADSIYVKFIFNSSDSLYNKAFQWLFDCVFEYTLSAQGLSQTISFINHGDVAFPFGVGFHTAFQIPGNPAFHSTDYKVMVSADLEWEATDQIPSGNLIPLPRDYRTGFINPLCEPIAEHLHSITFENYKIDDSLPLMDFHGAIITNTKSGKKIVYETDPLYIQWMIWNNKASKNYICIEPMTWTIDAPNATFPDELSGFQYLNPGQVWCTTNRIYCI